MKLTNVAGFDNIEGFVKHKLSEYEKEEKNFETLFEFMFKEKDNIMVETSDGYRINKISYGDFKKKILAITPTVCQALSGVVQGEMVGLYMSNCVEWLQIFWAILAAGYSPLIMNTRLPDEVLEGIINQYSLKCVISDGKEFSVTTLFKDDMTVPSEKVYSRRPFGHEVIFMSSGTTNNVKLCAYNGENFFYQICDSAKIIEKCKKIRNHYEGELKQLVLLPFCHVFGFIAVYLWFGFFSRTFVFPKDLNPDTVQRTVKKHKVTHIFAVPMVWEAIHRAAVNKIKERGEKTLNRFNRITKLVNNTTILGDLFSNLFLSEVRESLFGDSIQFLITGGSHIKPETLQFFNGIGYHLANGYGMTEIGITSLERSSKRKIINRGSIGAPFGCTEYLAKEDGTLAVRGKTRAGRIMQNGISAVTDQNEWFSTGDLVKVEGDRYYSLGRSDDLIICEDGENLNPLITEAQIRVDGVDGVCIFKSKQGAALVASVGGIFSEEALKKIYSDIVSLLSKNKLDSVIKKIYLTHEPLLGKGEFKISRRKICEKIEKNELVTFDPRHIDEHVDALMNGMEAQIAACFAEALGKDVSLIGPDDNFFRDLSGTSLDYFTLLQLLKTRLGVSLLSSDTAKLSSVKEFAEHIKTTKH